MTIYEFLSDRLTQLLPRLIFMVCASAFLSATGTRWEIVILVWLCWATGLFCTQTVQFFRQRSRLQELEKIMDGLDKKYLFFECIPKGSTIYERMLTDFLRRAGNAMIGAVSDAQESQRRYREYVESWVHEMKTPITAAHLVCQRAEPDIRRRLSHELSQMEAHVQRALYYARAESPEKDIIIRRISLDEIVALAISEHQSLLIQSGVRVETSGLGQMVYTDSKWAVFILGQLLQNAARYRKDGPVITIFARQSHNHVLLAVKDNGAGISAHELPRVFERGFTGSNGRTHRGSTGMGLYLCKKLADCLETDLQITSEPDKGTTVTLAFPSNLTNL